MAYYFDDERLMWYHFEARKIRIGDNVEIAEMRSVLSDRQAQGDISEERMLMLSNYILMKNAYKCFQISAVEVLPEDETLPTDWQDFALNEDTFNGLHEEFVESCIAEIYEKNPQRGLELEFLKKTRELLLKRIENGSITSNGTMPESVTGSESA